ncbi:rhomboid family protein [Stratiformator vulcanicus]|uniref:Intramembrane serine protease GlpG n=1 Tax=Stratiformator vulcanicus TaxID=2527980 RepID=A0A517R1T8_9PLAN|nr:rhomboid family intramembrane serine protease [Stratiformator vulcanicus]QDT37840.1 intramembrane serine protease GlpG [Stratiformator vulcanicus]
MGIEDREYLRDDTQGGANFFATDPATKWLIALIAGVFVLQILTSQNIQEGIAPLAQQWLDLTPTDILGGQIWRLVTYAFCHEISAPLQIIFNLLFLWWFGRTLEGMYGSREYATFFFATVLITGITGFLFGLAYDAGRPMYGATGAVMAVVTLYALHFPRQKILLFFIIPIEIRWLVGLFVAGNVLAALFELSSPDGIANVVPIASLASVGFAFLYQRSGWRISDGLPRGIPIPRFKRQPKLRVHDPEHAAEREAEDDLESKVDAALAKISEQGEASLTKSERKLLEEASRRYRQKG